MGTSESELQRRKYPEEPRVTEALPLIPYKVLASDLPFYRDPECTEQVEEARICVLIALDPDDVIVPRDIVPTFGRYEVGSYLEWSLESKRLWEDSWYRNPDTGEVERAWTFHVLFQGAVISEAAVEKERERISDLDKRTLAKLDSTTSPVN